MFAAAAQSPDGPPQLLAEYVYYVSEAIDALGWSQESSSSLTDGGHGKRDGREGDQQRREVRQLKLHGNVFARALPLCALRSAARRESAAARARSSIE